jgi:uncharacterized protein YkwD
MTPMRRASIRLPVRLVFAAALVALLASCRPMTTSEATLFAKTNDLRADHGLPVLEQQDALVDQARQWAQAMAARKSLSHSDPSTWNVSWTAVAENVGVSTSAGDLFARLQASPDHVDHMLSTKYTHLAIGTAVGKDGRIYGVQLFWRG